MLKAHKSADGDRAKKLFQFLNEIGARALGRHLVRTGVGNGGIVVRYVGV